jgi:glycerol dehydrogenase-like iron-containing ADH family enzyme
LVESVVVIVDKTVMKIPGEELEEEVEEEMKRKSIQFVECCCQDSKV